MSSPKDAIDLPAAKVDHDAEGAFLAKETYMDAQRMTHLDPVAAHDLLRCLVDMRGEGVDKQFAAHLSGLSDVKVNMDDKGNLKGFTFSAGEDHNFASNVDVTIDGNDVKINGHRASEMEDIAEAGTRRYRDAMLELDPHIKGLPAGEKKAITQFSDALLYGDIGAAADTLKTLARAGRTSALNFNDKSIYEELGATTLLDGRKAYYLAEFDRAVVFPEYGAPELYKVSHGKLGEKITDDSAAVRDAFKEMGKTYLSKLESDEHTTRELEEKFDKNLTPQTDATPEDTARRWREWLAKQGRDS